MSPHEVTTRHEIVAREQAAVSQVVTALASHGIAAQSASNGVFLSIVVAEHLVSVLDDLKTMEERGCV